jgi:hypothetical protein
MQRQTETLVVVSSSTGRITIDIASPGVVWGYPVPLPFDYKKHVDVYFTRVCAGNISHKYGRSGFLSL